MEKVTKPKSNKKTKAPLDEIGFSGVEISGGEINFDYQKKFKNLKDRVEICQQMRSDSSVDTALNLIELPLLSETPSIAPASESPEHIMHADFVRDQLLNESNVSLDYSYYDHKIEEVKYFQYGFMPFELVWKKGDWNKQDGSVMKDMTLLKKMAVRLPSSLEKWSFVNNELNGIYQEAPAGDIVVKTENIFIPIEKLLLYVNNKMGDNWEGISILRPIYKHWSYKEGLYKIEAIGLQKNAMSFPVLYMENPTPQRIAMAKKLIRSYMIHEEAGMILHKDKEELKHHTGGISTVAIHRSIAHHDSKILQNVLAGFMLLGQESRGGARNLGGSLIEFFMMSLDGKTKYSAQVKNRYLIKKMIDYNFTNVTQYPKLSAYCGRVSDKSAMMGIISQLVSNQFINPAETSLRDYVYNIFGLPNISTIKEKSGEEIDKPVSEDIVMDETELSIREKFPACKNDDRINKFRENWLPTLRKLTDKQKLVLSAQVHNILKEGGMPNINQLEVPYRSIYANMVKQYAEVMNEKFPNHRFSERDVEKLVNVHEIEIAASMAKSLINIARNKGTL